MDANVEKIKIHMDSKITVMNDQIVSVHKKTDKLIDCFALSNRQLGKVHELVVHATELVEPADSEISDNVNKLTEVNTRVDQNRNDIMMTMKKQE